MGPFWAVIPTHIQASCATDEPPEALFRAMHLDPPGGSQNDNGGTTASATYYCTGVGSHWPAVGKHRPFFLHNQATFHQCLSITKSQIIPYSCYKFPCNVYQNLNFVNQNLLKIKGSKSFSG